MIFKCKKAIDFCDDVRDGTHESPKRQKKGKILITSKNIKDGAIDYSKATFITLDDFISINKRSKVDINDVLFSMIGTIGLTYRVSEEPDYAIKNMGLFKISDELKSKWLYYYLKSPQGRRQIQSKLSGSTQKFISLSDLRALEIPYPEKREDMARVTRVLSLLDKKITNNEKENRTLNEIIKQLFKNFIGAKGPSWKRYNAEDLFDYTSGYSYTSAELVEESPIGMITIKNFERVGGFKTDGFKPLAPQKTKVPTANLFDIFVACTDVTQNADIIGNAIMLLDKDEYENATYSMDLVKIEPKINKFALYAILSSKDFKNFALGYKSGTTVLHLSKKCLKEYAISLPEEKEVEAFGEIVEKLCRKISNNLAENRNLRQIRNALLPKLLSGEIDVSRIEV